MILPDTTRLRFELLRDDHAPILFALHRDPEVMRYIRPPETSVDETLALIARMKKGMAVAPGAGLHLAFAKDGGDFIGWGLVKAFEHLPGNPIEIGYRLHRAAWGRGYATEISRALVDLVFGPMGRDRLIAVTNPGNLASQRVLAKCGLTRNGNLDYYGDDTFFFELRKGLRFVEYRPELHESFVALNREWLERHFEVEPTDAEMFADPEAGILAEGGRILFAELDGKVVGTCSLIRTGETEFELAKMAVTESAQGRGVGSLMIARTIDVARKAGANELFLLSNAKLGPALHLYERHGFRHEPVTEEDRAAYRRCDVRMRLKINI